MHHAKNCGNKEIPLAILSRILAQSCLTPPYIHNSGKGLHMIVLVSLTVLLRTVSQVKVPFLFQYVTDFSQITAHCAGNEENFCR